MEVVGLDHAYLTVSDTERAERFDDAVMERLGFEKGDKPIGGEPLPGRGEAMLHTTIARVDEQDVPRLRAWLASLASRRDELQESYRQGGTRHELFLLVRTRRLPILVLISELEDVEQATRSFLRSQLPIDVEFKTLYQELSPEEAEVELLYDSADYVDTAV